MFLYCFYLLIDKIIGEVCEIHLDVFLQSPSWFKKHQVVCRQTYGRLITNSYRLQTIDRMSNSISTTIKRRTKIERFMIFKEPIYGYPQGRLVFYMFIHYICHNNWNIIVNVYQDKSAFQTLPFYLYLSQYNIIQVT